MQSITRQKDRLHLRSRQSLTAWDGNDLTEWISGSAILISNDYELELISKMTGKDKKELLGLTKTIITTLGEKGSLISTAAGDITVPAAKAREVADPTGAGDAYRAAFSKGWSPVKTSNQQRRSAQSPRPTPIEKYGTQEHHFTVDEFKERYTANFGEEL